MVQSLVIGLMMGITSLSAVPLMADTISYSAASIETSNVMQDLLILKSNELGIDRSLLNVSDLYPEDTDIDPNFSFYYMYPSGSDMYFYLFEYTGKYTNPDYALLWLSTSTTQDDNGIFDDSFSSYQGELVNTYGDVRSGYFMKFVIHDLLSVGNEGRVCINQAVIYYDENPVLSTGGIHKDFSDEIWYQPDPDNENDFVAEYYKDTYVYIDDAEVGLLQTPRQYTNHTTANSTIKSYLGDRYEKGYKFYDYRSFYEDFYYFMNPVFVIDGEEFDIDDIQEIRYTYRYVTYEADLTYNKGGWAGRYNGVNRAACYNGLYDGSLGDYYQQAWYDKFDVDDPSITFVSSEQVTSSVVPEVIEHSAVASEGHFKWSTKPKRNFTFAVDSIFKLDDASIKAAEDSNSKYIDDPLEDDAYNYSGFLNFVDSVQTSKQAAYDAGDSSTDAYQWAFLVKGGDDSYRKVVTEDDPSDSISNVSSHSNSTTYAVCECHEVMDTLVTWMKFTVGNTDYECDVLSNPVSTSFTYTIDAGVPTLWNQISTWFESTGWNILMWIGIALGVVLVILLVYFIVKACRKSSKTAGNTMNINIGPDGVDTSSGNSKKKKNKDS